MDSRGRKAGLAAGFAGGAAICLSLWLSSSQRLLIPYLAGITAIGFVSGWLNLGARAGAADMYPPERRARGLGYVLCGAAVGAIFGPVLFSPMLEDASRDAQGLSAPWVAAAVLMLAGVALTALIRVDPTRFPQHEIAEQTPGGASVAALLRRPGVVGAIVAAVTAQVVMSSMMTVMGVALRDHGHHLEGVSLAISTHFLGMFALVLVVGVVVDRVGRARAMTGGLVILAAAAATFSAGAGFGSVLPAMFALGVGWNIAYVAATALMSDATRSDERGRLLGFADLLGSGGSAAGTIGAGALLDAGGLPLLAMVFTGLVVAALALSTGRAVKPAAA